jgi:type I restriction enzyme S subunit
MLSNEAIAHIKLLSALNINTEYIYLYLKNFDYNKLGSTSSIATAVNSKMLREIDVLVPIKDQLDSFQTKINSVFEKIKLNIEQIQTLQKIRDTLLPKLMSGEIRVLNNQKIKEAV